MTTVDSRRARGGRRLAVPAGSATRTQEAAGWRRSAVLRIVIESSSYRLVGLPFGRLQRRTNEALPLVKVCKIGPIRNGHGAHRASTHYKSGEGRPASKLSVPNSRLSADSRQIRPHGRDQRCDISASRNRKVASRVPNLQDRLERSLPGGLEFTTHRLALPAVGIERHLPPLAGLSNHVIGEHSDVTQALLAEQQPNQRLLTC